MSTAKAAYQLQEQMKREQERFDRMLSRARLTLKRTDELEHGKEVEDEHRTSDR